MLISFFLILDLGGVFTTIEAVVTWIALILTEYRLVDYLAKNKGITSEGDYIKWESTEEDTCGGSSRALKVDELTVLRQIPVQEPCGRASVDVPGGIRVFKQGFITYTNKAKRKLLM